MSLFVRYRMQKLLAVDPSLTCSGWASLNIESGRILAVGKIRSKPPSFALSERIADIQEKVELLYRTLELSGGDIVVCEAHTTVRDPKAAFKVEQVRTVFEAVARAHGIRVPGRLHPRTVQTELLGLRGKQLRRDIVKETAAGAVLHLFRDDLERLGIAADREVLRKHQDIVDAILIGSLALTRIESARRGDLHLDTLFTK